mgnify:CR=1 FL=1
MEKYSKSSEETEKMFNKILKNQDFVGIIENMVEGKSSSKKFDSEEILG